MPWFAMQPADDAFFDTAPILLRFPTPLAAPPEQVWASLTSDDGIAAWGRSAHSLRWTSPRPFGVGTTRDLTVALRVATVREHFYRWEDGVSQAFYVEASTAPGLRRLAEDWTISPDGDGTMLEWTVAIEPTPALTPALRAGRRALHAAFGRIAADGKKYFAARG